MKSACFFPRTFAAFLFLLPFGGVAVAEDAPIQATDLAREFAVSSPPSSMRYQDKVIVVTGVVDAIKISPNTGNRIAILKSPPKDNVMIRFRPSETEATASVQPGQTITIQGLCRVFESGVALGGSVLVKTPAGR